MLTEDACDQIQELQCTREKDHIIIWNFYFGILYLYCIGKD